jgi:hypothetical protein
MKKQNNFIHAFCNGHIEMPLEKTSGAHCMVLLLISLE